MPHCWQSYYYCYAAFLSLPSSARLRPPAPETAPGSPDTDRYSAQEGNDPPHSRSRRAGEPPPLLSLLLRLLHRLLRLPGPPEAVSGVQKRGAESPHLRGVLHPRILAQLRPPNDDGGAASVGGLPDRGLGESEAPVWLVLGIFRSRIRCLNCWIREIAARIERIIFSKLEMKQYLAPLSRHHTVAAKSFRSLNLLVTVKC